MIKQGDQVICIDDSMPSNPKALQHKNWIKKNNPYTVRALVTKNGSLVGLLLNEVINPKVFDPIAESEFEPGFAIWRFKKPDNLIEVNQLTDELQL